MWWRCSLAILVVFVSVFSAWDFGGVLPWTQWLMISILGLATLCSATLLRSGLQNLRWLSLGPLAIVWVACGFILLQSSSLPNSVSSILSPGVANAYQQGISEFLWQEFEQVASARSPGLQQLPRPVQNSLAEATAGIDRNHHPLSLRRDRTRQWIAVPLAVGLTLLICLLAIRDPQSVFATLLAIAIAGSFLAAVSILNLSKPSKTVAIQNSVIQGVHNAAPFGPFINKNNAAGYLNLTLAATVGLLMWSVRKSQRVQQIDPGFEIPPETTWDRITQPAFQSINQMSTPTLAVTTIMILQLAAIAASQSRGGLIAAVAGFLILFARRMCRGVHDRSRATRIMSIAGGSIIGLISLRLLLEFLELNQLVSRSVGSIFSLSEGSQVGRLAHLADAFPAMWHYLPMGAGMGTYQSAITVFQESQGGNFVHADCLPVELVVEGGLWASGLTLLLVVNVAALAKRLERHGTRHAGAAMASLWFLLGSQATASLFDFGILLPANAVTAAILVGVACATISTSPPKSVRTVSGSVQRLSPKKAAGEPSRESSGDTKVLDTVGTTDESPIAKYASVAVRPSCAFLYAISLGFTWFAWHQTRRFASEDHLVRSWIQRQSVSIDSETSTEHSAGLLVKAHAAANLNRYASALILAEQNRIGKSHDIANRLADPDLSDSERVMLLSADGRLSTRRYLYYSQPEADEIAPEDVLFPGQDINAIRHARHLALVALLQNPNDPMARILLIETDFLNGNQSNLSNVSANLVRDCLRLAPLNDTVAEKVARLAYVFPGPESASEPIKRWLALRPSAVEEAWPMLESLNDPERILDLIPDDIRVVMAILSIRELPERLRLPLISVADDLLQSDKSIDFDWGEREYLTYQLAMIQNDPSAAAAAIESAVFQSPADVRYRLIHAEMLMESGKSEEAIKNLRRVLLQSPENSKAADLLGEISLRRQRDNANNQ